MNEPTDTIERNDRNEKEYYGSRRKIKRASATDVPREANNQIDK